MVGPPSSEVARPRRVVRADSGDLWISVPLAPRRAQLDPPVRTAGALRPRCSPRDSACSESTPAREATVLFKIALTVLVVWGLGVAGLYTIGQIVHVLLLVGLMLLLLSFARAHDAAARQQGSGEHR